MGKSVSFFPLVPSREHPLLSIRGTVGVLPSRMPQAFLPTTNTARAAGRGIKGGEAPFAGGPGTRRSLAYLCLLSLREKVGRGAGRSARIGRCWGYQPRKISPGVGRVGPLVGAGAKSNDLLPRGSTPSKTIKTPAGRRHDALQSRSSPRRSTCCPAPPPRRTRRWRGRQGRSSPPA